MAMGLVMATAAPPRVHPLEPLSGDEIAAAEDVPRVSGGWAAKCGSCW